jgi:hypothetical protein
MKRRAMRPLVLGSIPTNGALPIFGKHKGTDAIFALAYNYSFVDFARFVGSLRRSGYTEDIVLGVSPREELKPEIQEYLQMHGVVSYEFQVECVAKDSCRLKDTFFGFVASLLSVTLFVSLCLFFLTHCDLRQI